MGIYTAPFTTLDTDHLLSPLTRGHSQVSEVKLRTKRSFDLVILLLGSFSGDGEGDDDDDGDSDDDDEKDQAAISVDLPGEVFKMFFSPKSYPRYLLRVVSVSLSYS